MDNKLNFLSIENRDSQGNITLDFFINGKRIDGKIYESLLQDYFETNNSDINNIENLNLDFKNEYDCSEDDCSEDDSCPRCEKIRNIVEVIQDLDSEESFYFLSQIFNEIEEDIQKAYKQGASDMCFNFIDISNNLARHVSEF